MQEQTKQSGHVMNPVYQPSLLSQDGWKLNLYQAMLTCMLGQ